MRIISAMFHVKNYLTCLLFIWLKDSLYPLSELEQKQLGLIHVAENWFYIGFCY